jgi:hypothetical protein
LDALHLAIFDAFDREDAHLYEFQIGGKEPMDRKAVKYGIAPDLGRPGDKSAKSAAIAALNLKPGSSFFYWFDFGDDWWHEIRLLAVNSPEKGNGRYPRIVERKGESPPQYVDWDAEEDENGLDAEGALTSRIILTMESVPAAPVQQRRDAISALMKDFCKAHLTESYIGVCENLLGAACGEGLPLERGMAQSWAAGMVHAAGMINFLHDPAFKPYMKLRDIAQHFGVSPATMENKSREIRDAVNTFPSDPRFCLPELLADNPLTWMKQVGGIFVDFRAQPREVQEAALKSGLIPFIPETPTAAAPQKQKTTDKKSKKNATAKREEKPEQYGLLE